MPFIRLQLGRDVTPEELHKDWVLVHEMVHLALPEVGDDHLWLTEGLSTYIEGIARVHAGDLRAERVWLEQMRSMPQGLPAPGDEGLDNTHTWGRTYWGGALFCLLADVEIRKKTANRFGLRDAMRAVLRQSGGVAFESSIDRVMKVGDEATGTTVLRDLYAQMKDKPVSPDLPELWRQLGIASAATAWNCWMTRRWPRRARRSWRRELPRCRQHVDDDGEDVARERRRIHFRADALPLRRRDDDEVLRRHDVDELAAEAPGEHRCRRGRLSEHHRYP